MVHHNVMCLTLIQPKGCINLAHGCLTYYIRNKGWKGSGNCFVLIFCKALVLRELSEICVLRIFWPLPCPRCYCNEREIHATFWSSKQEMHLRLLAKPNSLGLLHLQMDVTSIFSNSIPMHLGILFRSKNPCCELRKGRSSFLALENWAIAASLPGGHGLYVGRRSEGDQDYRE